jgi:hypothetical protein
MDAKEHVPRRPFIITIICILASLASFCLYSIEISNAHASTLQENKAESEIMARVGKTFWVGKVQRYATPVTFHPGLSSSTGFNLLEKTSFKIIDFISMDIHRPEMGIYEVRFESGEEATINCSQFSLHLAKTDTLPGKGSRQEIFAEDPDLIHEKRIVKIKERLKEIEQKEQPK